MDVETVLLPRGQPSEVSNDLGLLKSTDLLKVNNTVSSLVWLSLHDADRSSRIRFTVKTRISINTLVHCVTKGQESARKS